MRMLALLVLCSTCIQPTFADELPGKEHSTTHSGTPTVESPLESRLKNILASTPRATSTGAAPKLASRTALRAYLDLEFRGVLEPADSIGGEQILRKSGLVEVYKQGVDERISRMESTLLKQCTDPLDKHLKELLRRHSESLGFKLDSHVVKNSGAARKHAAVAARKMLREQQTAPMRRLALLAFMTRENSERRAQRMSQALDGETAHERALGAFESEFWENFAASFEGEKARERLRLRSQGETGVALLKLYDQLIEDVTTAIESGKKMGPPTNFADADEVIGELSLRFTSSANACPVNREQVAKEMDYLTQIIGKLNWTERNRRMVLDYILGEQPRVPQEHAELPLNSHMRLIEKRLPSGKGDYLRESEIISPELLNLLRDKLNIE